MKILIMFSFLFLASCNPELKTIGSSPNDLVKYFKLSSGSNGIGDGVVIIANIADKRLLTFYIRQPSGNYAHTDVMIKNSSEYSFEVESIYSLTPDCKLNPDKGQPQYYEQLLINGTPKLYNREILSREEAMGTKRTLGC